MLSDIIPFLLELNFDDFALIWLRRRRGDLRVAPSLLSFLGRSGHLHQAAFAELEEPPALLLGEVLGAAPLVELDGWLVVLRHDEHHARAAHLYRQLEKAGRS